VDIRATASTGNRPVESSTRERVLRDISTLGPITTSTLVERLGLTETAVRRHVENLHAEGLIEGRDQVGQRGRGRPARAWVLSAQGHAHLHLAEGAIRFLATHAGRGAVRSFADERARGLAQRCQEQMPDANAPVAERTVS
jgi:predicted ArsR family transcriptional regulator